MTPKHNNKHVYKEIKNILCQSVPMCAQILSALAVS